MTLDNVVYGLAGGVLGFIVGLIVEAWQMSQKPGIDAAAKVAQINAEAAAADKAIDDKTQSVIKETEGLSGQRLADAINQDLATPPVVPVLRSASNDGAEAGGARQPAGDPASEPAGKPPLPGK